MKELNWSHQQPVAPGWYWVRGAYSNDVILEARQIDSGRMSMDDGVQDVLQCSGVQFAGPIPKPVGDAP